MKSKFRL